MSYDQRITVPKGNVPWDVPYPDYQPPYYTDDFVLSHPDLAPGVPIDSEDIADYPKNPDGRTGLAGRGLLFFWGANHACDLVLVADDNGDKKVLLGQRSDNHMWSVPGGMVDPGEDLIDTAVRELYEEAGISISKDGIELFREGTNGDSRNTDNAWIVAHVFIKHVEDMGSIEPQTSNETIGVGWFGINDLPERMHANHRQVVEEILSS